MNPVIIIGTGLAGYQVAREFRKIDTTTPLMFLTTDDGRFYSKPLLSTALTNKKNFETLTTSSAEAMAQQLNASIKSHCIVSEINPDKKLLHTNLGDFHYSKLVLAVGAEVIRPMLEGNAANEVISVNGIFDYHAFHTQLQSKKRITILGAGLIGCEFANDLSNAGFDVHVIALSKAPLDLLLPETVGKKLQEALEQNGVTFHFECTVNAVNKKGDTYTLTLSNGEILQTELVMSAIGLRPNLQLAKNTELQTNRGFIVNRYLETSITDIYALGDCAEVEGHVLPYITPLLNSARALAKTLANTRTAVDYPAMPVIVKTPAHPIDVCPPPRNMTGTWKIESQDNALRALFLDDNQVLHGFVLTNEAVKERMNLAKLIPNLF